MRACVCRVWTTNVCVCRVWTTNTQKRRRLPKPCHWSVASVEHHTRNTHVHTRTQTHTHTHIHTHTRSSTHIHTQTLKHTHTHTHTHSNTYAQARVDFAPSYEEGHLDTAIAPMSYADTTSAMRACCPLQLTDISSKQCLDSIYVYSLGQSQGDKVRE